MPEIPETRLAEWEARWRKAAEALVRLAEQRPTWDTVDIVCAHSDVPELVAEVRRLRGEVAEYHREWDKAKATCQQLADAADKLAADLAKLRAVAVAALEYRRAERKSDCVWTESDGKIRAQLVAHLGSTRTCLDSALRDAGIGGGA